MAWNQYYIMVSNQNSPISKEQLGKLGLGKYEEVGKVKLDETNKPTTLFTAHFSNSIIIVHPDLPFKLSEEKPSEEEKKFIDCFPNSTIASLIENSSVNMFGFTIIEKGKRVRMKDGSDGEIYNDYGEPLPEESESYKDFASRMDDDEKEELIEDLGENGFEDYLKFQAAWSVPNMLSKRFLGEYIGAIEGDKMEFTKYKLS